MATVFDRIDGQRPAVETLVSALRNGRVHHAYRFEGPDGVGKELAAFALAQSLVCERGGKLGCGECSACTRAVRIAEEDPRVPQHPDVVLLGRGLYPASALGTASRETVAIGVEQVRRVVLSRVGFTPHEARSLVFIIRDAHELTPQAANALLKTLEEPASHVHFVLLTSQPNRLLDTIRSRTLAVRFGPLPDAVVEAILERHGKPKELARLAGGSAAAALVLADEDVARRRERSSFVAPSKRRSLPSSTRPSCLPAPGPMNATNSSRTCSNFLNTSRSKHVTRSRAIRGAPRQRPAATRRCSMPSTPSSATRNRRSLLESMVARLRAMRGDAPPSSRCRFVTRASTPAIPSSGSSARMTAPRSAWTPISPARSTSMPPIATSGIPAARQSRPATPSAGDADDRARPVLGSGREHRTIRDVVGSRRQSRSELHFVMCRHPDAELWRKAPDLLETEVFLSDVHAVASGEHREIGSIVGEERNAGSVAKWPQGTKPGERLACALRLRPELDRCGFRQDDTLGERYERNPDAFQEVRVDDRVEAAHHVGCGVRGEMGYWCAHGPRRTIGCIFAISVALAPRTTLAGEPNATPSELTAAHARPQGVRDGTRESVGTQARERVTRRDPARGRPAPALVRGGAARTEEAEDVPSAG